MNVFENALFDVNVFCSLNNQPNQKWLQLSWVALPKGSLLYSLCRTAVLSHIAVRTVNLIERKVSGDGRLQAALHRTSATACARTPDCAHTEARVSLGKLRRKRSMLMLLMGKIPYLGPFSSAALVAMRLQP